MRNSITENEIESIAISYLQHLGYEDIKSAFNQLQTYKQTILSLLWLMPNI